MTRPRRGHVLNQVPYSREAREAQVLLAVVAAAAVEIAEVV